MRLISSECNDSYSERSWPFRPRPHPSARRWRLVRRASRGVGVIPVGEPSNTRLAINVEEIWEEVQGSAGFKSFAVMMTFC